MIKPFCLVTLCVAALLAGCGGSAGENTGSPAPAAPTTVAAAPSVTSAQASPSPSLSPTYVPKLPTVMTDEGGSCISEDRCGYYVAGSSCKGVEWCKKKDLVEPGIWATEGGSGPTDCMWEVSHPPAYEFDDGGYAGGYNAVELKKGSIFSTEDCLAGWTWLKPA